MYRESERLILRDPVLEDWQGAHGFLADPAVMRWIHLGPLPYSEAQSRHWITDLIFHNRQQPRTSHNALIVERASHSVIGWIGIGKPSAKHAAAGDLDFGYALAQAYWGQGVMTEALHMLLTFAFTELGANRVFATCEVQNIGSYRVMEKAKMKREQRYTEADGHKEMFLYAISKTDWKAPTMSE